MEQNKQINVGDMITGSSGRLGPCCGWRGVVKSIEMVRLERDCEPTPRYHVTDGDYAWWLDHREVVFVNQGVYDANYDKIREACA